MLRTIVTLDRVLRINEILVDNPNSRLKMLSEVQLKPQQEAMKLLCQRNEKTIEKQSVEALRIARK